MFTRSTFNYNDPLWFLLLGRIVDETLFLGLGHGPIFYSPTTTITLFSRGTRTLKIKECLFFYFSSLFSSLFSHPLFRCHLLFFYRHSPYLILPTGLPLTWSFWDISHSSIGFSPLLILKQDFWGVFVLFRLSYMHLMWKKLDREPLINAKVIVFVILILLGNFLRYTWWEWHLGIKREISSISLICIFQDHPCLLPHMRVSMLAAYLELLENHLGDTSLCGS